MDNWINLRTILAFILGVIMAAWVKMMVAQLRSKAGGA